LWYSDSMLNTLFLISKMRKGNKDRKKITDTGWENKERKKWEEWKWELLFALVIGQEAVLSEGGIGVY